MNLFNPNFILPVLHPFQLLPVTFYSFTCLQSLSACGWRLFFTLTREKVSRAEKCPVVNLSVVGTYCIYSRFGCWLSLIRLRRKTIILNFCFSYLLNVTLLCNCKHLITLHNGLPFYLFGLERKACSFFQKWCFKTGFHFTHAWNL